MNPRGAWKKTPTQSGSGVEPDSSGTDTNKNGYLLNFPKDYAKQLPGNVPRPPALGTRHRDCSRDYLMASGGRISGVSPRQTVRWIDRQRHPPPWGGQLNRVQELTDGQQHLLWIEWDLLFLFRMDWDQDLLFSIEYHCNNTCHDQT